MSNDLNLCQFIGRLGKDPEVRYSKDGKAMANFSIACGQSWKDKQTSEKVERTEWIRVTAFGKLAEIIGEYLKKGAHVYISGRMQTRKWKNKEGVDQYTTEIIADTMQMLGGKRDREETGTAEQAAPVSPQPDFDDDIPF